MYDRAFEAVRKFLERTDREELLPVVERAIQQHPFSNAEAREVIIIAAQNSQKLAQGVLALLESSHSSTSHYDLDELRREVSLVEEEKEVQALANSDNGATLEAHLTVFSLLPETQKESMERQRRILASALAVNQPIRAAEFIRDIRPEHEAGFWRFLRLRLVQRLRTESPLHAIPLIDSPRYALQWLLDSAKASSVETEAISLLINRMREIGISEDASRIELLELIDFLMQGDFAQSYDLLYKLVDSGLLPMEDRAVVLARLAAVGSSLSESERIHLADAVAVRIQYFKWEDRRAVLRKLANLTRYCPPEIRRKIRILRACALLVHLSPSRLDKAYEWRHAYPDEHRFLISLRSATDVWGTRQVRRIRKTPSYD